MLHPASGNSPVLLLIVLSLSSLTFWGITKLAFWNGPINPRSKHRRNLVETSVQSLNITIDDEEGDPTNQNHFSYYPSFSWQQGGGCGGCAAQPNASEALSGTWHDSSYYSIGDPGPNPATAGFISKAAVQFTGKHISPTLTIIEVFHQHE